VSSSLASALRIPRRAARDLCLDKVCGPLSDGWKQDSGAVRTRSVRCMTGRSALPRDSSNYPSVDAAKFSVTSEPGSTGEFESSRDVRLTVLIVAEDSLDPAQGLQARRKIKACPVSAASWVNSPGRGVRRCDLAAAELDLGGQGERKDQDRRRASRSRRTDNAVEHSAGVHPLVDPHQRSGRFRRSRTKAHQANRWTPAIRTTTRPALGIHDRRAG
jgi:hypothetical protein